MYGPPDEQAFDFPAALADGSLVQIRPPAPSDRAALSALHDRVSQRSRYLRYFSLSRRSAEQYVDTVLAPHSGDLPGLVAILDGELVAVASYERLSTAEAAEVAFLVDDLHQGLGIATLLLETLGAAAAQRGVDRFVAEVLPENAHMLEVFSTAGYAVSRRFADGVVHIEFPLAPTEVLLEKIAERERAAGARSIRRLLSPTSVAVIGAGRDPDGIGHAVLRNLVAGGFRGSVYPVNASAAEVAGRPAYPSVLQIPAAVDLAVIAVPAIGVPAVVSECAAAGVSGVVLVSAGFAETGTSGAASERELVMSARRGGMRLVGPNCFGVVNTAADVQLNATFSAMQPSAGRVGVLTQSGAVGIALLDEMSRHRLGVSSFVSVGNRADVSSNDLLMYWDQDDATDVVLMYLESFGNPRKFARTSRRVSGTKPIVAIKGGRSAAGARAVRSHTAAALTPAYASEALFRQAGIIRVDALEEMLPVAEILLSQPPPAGRRVAIVGNSGGPGALAADSCEAAGLSVPVLDAALQAQLRAILPHAASVSNPVDMAADATAEDYSRALSVVAGADVDAVVVISARTGATSGGELSAAVRQAANGAGRPVVLVRLGADREPAAAVPEFAYPEPAVRALAHVMDYADWRRRPSGMVPALPRIDQELARGALRRFLTRHPEGGWLPSPAAAEMVLAYGIPVVQTVPVASAEEAGLAAARLGYPVALKAADPTLVHKSDVGGVSLGLSGTDEVVAAYEEMARRLGNRMPAGAVVQPMAPPGLEVIIGVVQDPVFGPLVMLGAGGVMTELLDDRVYRLLPLTDLDAAEMVRSLRTSPLFFGYRNQPAVDAEALEQLLLRVARLADDFPEVAEIDLNPVILSEDGAVGCDVKIYISNSTPGAPDWLRRLD